MDFQNMGLLDLRDRLLQLTEEAEAVKDKDSTEGRIQVNRIYNEFRQVEAEIDNREMDLAEKEAIMRGKVSQSQGRKAEPNQPQGSAGSFGEPSRRGYGAVDGGKFNANMAGQFFQCVASSCRPGGLVDPRLVMNAPTTYSQEGVGVDGGFAVPLDFRTAIWQKVTGEDSLLSRTDQQKTGSNTFTVPADETTPWDTSGGIQAYWESEAGQITQSKVALQDKTIRLNKLTILVPVTSELLEDAPGLAAHVMRSAAQKINHKLNLKLVQGTGAGEPLGILNATSSISVAAEVGQDADTIILENILGMHTAFWPGAGNNGVWLMHKKCFPQIIKLSLTVGLAGQPVFMPADNAAGRPFSTLLGYPITLTECCEPLGDKGDIILCDFSQYLTVVKKTGGIRSDVSMHLFFDYDLLCFRFIIRVAGMPWWASTLVGRDGISEYSAFVSLDERS